MNMIGEILLYKELPKEGGKVGAQLGAVKPWKNFKPKEAETKN